MEATGMHGIGEGSGYGVDEIGLVVPSSEKVLLVFVRQVDGKSLPLRCFKELASGSRMRDLQNAVGYKIALGTIAFMKSLSLSDLASACSCL